MSLSFKKGEPRGYPRPSISNTIAGRIAANAREVPESRARGTIAQRRTREINQTIAEVEMLQEQARQLNESAARSGTDVHYEVTEKNGTVTLTKYGSGEQLGDQPVATAQEGGVIFQSGFRGTPEGEPKDGFQTYRENLQFSSEAQIKKPDRIYGTVEALPKPSVSQKIYRTIVPKPAREFILGFSSGVGLTERRSEFMQRPGGATAGGATSYEAGIAAAYVANPRLWFYGSKGAGALATSIKPVTTIIRPVSTMGKITSVTADTALGAGVLYGTTKTAMNLRDSFSKKVTGLSSENKGFADTFLSGELTPLSRQGIMTQSVIGLNRLTEAGGRKTTAAVFEKLGAKKKFLSTGQLFNIGALSIAPQGAIEGVTDIGLYRASRKESISPLDMVVGSSGGASIAGFIGGGIIAAPYIKNPLLKRSVSFSENVVNIVDPAEKPGDYFQDIAERSYMLKGGRVKTAFSLQTKKGIKPGTFWETAGSSVKVITPSLSTTSKNFGKNNIFSLNKAFTFTKATTKETTKVSSPTKTTTPSIIKTLLPTTTKTPVSTRTSLKTYTTIKTPVNIKTPVSTKTPTVVKTPVTVSNVPAFFPPFLFPESGGIGRFFSTGRAGKRKPKYTPSLLGVELGIKGSSRKAGGYSGLEVRGLSPSELKRRLTGSKKVRI